MIGEAYRREITCPFCGYKFEGMEMEEGECPQCGEAYFWDVQWEDGYEEEQVWLWWKKDKLVRDQY